LNRKNKIRNVDFIALSICNDGLNEVVEGVGGEVNEGQKNHALEHCSGFETSAETSFPSRSRCPGHIGLPL
jgi:hypothetical protein